MEHKTSKNSHVDHEQYLRDLYFNPESPVAYSGISKIWKKIKEDREATAKLNNKLMGASPVKVLIKYKELKEFLDNLPTYQLHEPATQKFTFRKTMASYADQQWQADLVDMQKFEKSNKGYRYILTVIDIFSRYTWALPLKSKRGEEVRDLFVDIFEQAKPEKLQFDDGKEFYNKDLKSLLTENKIEWFSTYTDKKAAVVERLNRTLKSKMWKYFTAKETDKWIDVLPKLVSGYNNAFHSTIGMSPLKAREEENAGAVWYNLYGAHLTHDFGKPKYKVGDSVRISKYKTIFSKGYLPNFTEEIFKIRQIIFTKPIVYQLEDFQNEELKGYFYPQELSFVPNPDDIEYKIEKVLRHKTVKGKKYSLVKYKGWGDKFNEWLPASTIKQL